MLYFYEKIDLFFELFSSYELKKNKKRLLKNISIWILQAIEKDSSKTMLPILKNHLDNAHSELAKDFSLEKISSTYQSFLKVLS